MKFASLAALGCAVVLFASSAHAQDYDLLIQNGRIVDGAGNASFVGDLAILNGKVAALGNLPGAKAKRRIDATGLVVSPGFIDIHNHSDYTLVADGNAQSMIRQGVTSMIFGEGGSAAPVGGKQDLKPGDVTWSDFKG